MTYVTSVASLGEFPQMGEASSAGLRPGVLVNNGSEVVAEGLFWRSMGRLR